MKPSLINGTFTITNREFRASIDAQYHTKEQRERHAVRVVRNELDTGWDITCTCEPVAHPGDPIVIASTPDSGWSPERSRWVAYAEAWDHIARCADHAITGD